ncbi:MAG: hypothetical protein IJM43_09710 [Bacteroidaceae bacterium]|nr:hypothetical protein [Bacteroidaceae bacterium]
MKRMAYFLTMVLMLPLFVACSNDTEEELLLPQETPSVVKGTETREADERPYWWLWANSQKLYFTYLDTKAFIYYHPSDREVIVQKLAERGLKLEREPGYEYSLGFYPPKYTNKGENAFFLSECVWNEVSASYKDLIDIPEILDACPNIQEEGSSRRFRGTSCILINTKSYETLQEIAEEYKVHIVGTQDEDICFVSYVVCDKNSKGNAFEIARDLWEKNHIGAEPGLIVMTLL